MEKITSIIKKHIQRDEGGNPISLERRPPLEELHAIAQKEKSRQIILTASQMGYQAEVWGGWLKQITEYRQNGETKKVDALMLLGEQLVDDPGWGLDAVRMSIQMAEMYFEDGNREKALAMINAGMGRLDFVSLHPPNDVGRCTLYASIAKAYEKYQDASNSRKSWERSFYIADKLTDEGQLSTVAACYVFEGQVDRGVELAKKTSEVHQAKIPALLMTAQREDLADQIIAGINNNNALASCAKELITLGHTDKAREVLKRVKLPALWVGIVASAMADQGQISDAMDIVRQEEFPISLIPAIATAIMRHRGSADFSDSMIQELADICDRQHNIRDLIISISRTGDTTTIINLDRFLDDEELVWTMIGEMVKSGFSESAIKVIKGLSHREMLSVAMSALTLQIIENPNPLVVTDTIDDMMGCFRPDEDPMIVVQSITAICSHFALSHRTDFPDKIADLAMAKMGQVAPSEAKTSQCNALAIQLHATGYTELAHQALRASLASAEECGQPVEVMQLVSWAATAHALGETQLAESILNKAIPQVRQVREREAALNYAYLLVLAGKSAEAIDLATRDYGEVPDGIYCRQTDLIVQSLLESGDEPLAYQVIDHNYVPPNKYIDNIFEIARKMVIQGKTEAATGLTERYLRTSPYYLGAIIKEYIWADQYPAVRLWLANLDIGEMADSKIRTSILPSLVSKGYTQEALDILERSGMPHRLELSQNPLVQFVSLGQNQAVRRLRDMIVVPTEDYYYRTTKEEIDSFFIRTAWQEQLERYTEKAEVPSRMQPDQKRKIIRHAQKNPGNISTTMLDEMMWAGFSQEELTQVITVFPDSERPALARRYRQYSGHFWLTVLPEIFDTQEQKLLGDTNIPWDALYHEWKDSGKNILKVTINNIRQMAVLERRRPGAAMALYRHPAFRLAHFSRYPIDLLEDQYDFRNKHVTYGLLLVAKGDHNGAFYQIAKVLKDLQHDLTEHGYHIRISEAGNRFAIARRLTEFHRRFGKFHKIAFRIVAAHGLPQSISFDRPGNERVMTTDYQVRVTMGKWFKGRYHKHDREEIFEPGSPAVYISCSTGQPEGIAQKDSTAYGGMTNGPEEPTQVQNIRPIFQDGKIIAFNVEFQSGDTGKYAAGQAQTKDI